MRSEPCRDVIIAEICETDFLKAKRKGGKNPVSLTPTVTPMFLSVGSFDLVWGPMFFVWVSTVSSTRPHDFRLSDQITTKEK